MPDGESYFGKIEGLAGVRASGETPKACSEELQEVLEEWIVVGFKKGRPIPAMENVNLSM